MGRLVPEQRQEHPAPEEGKPAHRHEGPRPLHRTGRRAFCHAGDRKRTRALLQLLIAALRRRSGRRRHDHPFQRDAVRDAAAAGPDPGRSADHQLQLRRHAGTARQKGIPPADHRLLHLLILAVGRRGTVPIIVRRHLYQ